MRLRDDCDYLQFMKTVEKCEGEVFFETADGDCLALRSSFCQYIFSNMIEQAAFPVQGTIRLERDSDLALLAQYLER